MNEARVKVPHEWRCIRFVKRLEGDGVTRPLLCQALSESTGARVDVVVKVRTPDTPFGHNGATSLASELVCAILAAALELPVPEFGVISLNGALAEGIVDAEVAALVRRNEGANFATVYQRSYAPLAPLFSTTGKALIEALESVVTYDAAVFNGDRDQCNPNLLWGGDDLLMIDHSLAMPIHLWRDEQLEASPIMSVARLKDHVSHSSLLGRKRKFELVIERWLQAFTDRDFDAIVELVPKEWETRAGDLDKIVKFLKNRSRRFKDIQQRLRHATMKKEAL